MHELPVTERILSIVIAYAKKNDVKKVINIHLSIGEMSDLEDEWIQKYFDHLSRETVAQDARLIIKRIPVTMRCEECSFSYQIDIKRMEEIQCPRCQSKKSSITSGREYYIKDMEVL